MRKKDNKLYNGIIGSIGFVLGCILMLGQLGVYVAMFEYFDYNFGLILPLMIISQMTFVFFGFVGLKKLAETGEL